MNFKNKHTLHPWHGISNQWDQEKILGVVEIPRGERCKFEIDKSSGLLKLDRVLSSSFEYPVNYGFIPQTLEDDGDPLDVLIFSKFPLPSLCLVSLRVIGLLHMEDRDRLDHKILTVADTDITQSHIQKMEDISLQTLNELRHFFEQYTILENKKVEVKEFGNLEQARFIIDQCILRYHQWQE